MDSSVTRARTAHARAPKQDRSRESLDRVLEAAAELLTEKGYGGFTLGGVSRRSRVSIGSIYCRFASKDDLFRAVQGVVLDKMDQEFAAMLTRIRRRALPLRELVPALVSELAHFLRRNAGILSPLIERATVDQVIRNVGKKSYFHTALDFKLLLLERRAEFVHPDPEHAAEMVFTITYGALARYLGIGGLRDAVGEGHWKRLVEDLGAMALGYLLIDARSLARASPAPR